MPNSEKTTRIMPTSTSQHTRRSAPNREENGANRQQVGMIGESARCRFAVETLLRWYRNGEDPKRRLPILSTYLGHAHVTDTYWYLTGTTELLGAAGKRLEKRWEGLNAGR